MDRWTDGQMDGRTDGWMDGRMLKLTSIPNHYYGPTLRHVETFTSRAYIHIRSYRKTDSQPHITTRTYTSRQTHIQRATLTGTHLETGCRKLDRPFAKHDHAV